MNVTSLTGVTVGSGSITSLSGVTYNNVTVGSGSITSLGGVTTLHGITVGPGTLAITTITPGTMSTVRQLQLVVSLSPLMLANPHYFATNTLHLDATSKYFWSWSFDGPSVTLCYSLQGLGNVNEIHVRGRHVVLIVNRDSHSRIKWAFDPDTGIFIQGHARAFSNSAEVIITRDEWWNMVQLRRRREERRLAQFLRMILPCRDLIASVVQFATSWAAPSSSPSRVRPSSCGAGPGPRVSPGH